VRTEKLTRHVAVRSLCSPEDAYHSSSERPCFPAFSIPEEPSGGTQHTKKSRGHSGSPPLVLSSQSADTTLDTMVSWSLTNHWMQILTNCLQDCLVRLLLVVVACISVLYNLFATSQCYVVASRRQHQKLPHQLQSSRAFFTFFYTSNHEHVLRPHRIAPVEH
jgi:hypothetical protein